MARPRKLNDQRVQVVHEEVLKENPDGFSDELADPNPVVIAKHIPEYRRVQFLNGRDPGVALQFHYSSGTHPLKQYTLYHGYEHDLPVEVITHLESCNEPQYGYRKNERDEVESFIKSRKFIFQFRTPPKKVA